MAEMALKPTGVNPLWAPPWDSIEPSRYDPTVHLCYGAGLDARLLAGIMGHNLCLDLFGDPSSEEAALGLTPHAESSVSPYEFTMDGKVLVGRATFPLAQLEFERRISLSASGSVVLFTETVENRAAFDRPLAWTQHVTLGPPFLERGVTQFSVPATRSKTYEIDLWGGHGGMKAGAEFDWPYCPLADGTIGDLRIFTNAPVSGGITAHLLDENREHAYFVVYSPGVKVAFGYIWRRTDFPWMTRWEENHCRTQPPWNGRTLACGLEFGASPMPESRREMVGRGSLFGVPSYRWLPARSRVRVDYCAFIGTAPGIPHEVVWDGGEKVRLLPS